MPELPELEALARALGATVTGRDIVAMEVRSSSLERSDTLSVRASAWSAENANADRILW